jgi:hypothetical protein
MAPLEAKKVIESLANGIDPETGEVLPPQSALNSPTAIRALFIASKALDSAAKHADRKNSLPAMAGRPWGDEEDQALLAAFDASATVKEMAAKHGRTLGAITSRLTRLGKIKDRSEVYVTQQITGTRDARK